MKLVQYFDGHIIINLFGLIIRIRMDSKVKIHKINSYGLNKELKRYRPIVVSLTSFPERINIVVKTIETLLNQTLKPDMVILWLASEQFPNKEQDLPRELLELTKLGLTINWCENLRSYKKIIPALKNYPDSIIVTVDDDIYYASDTLESLYKSYLEYPNEIHAHRCDWLTVKQRDEKNKNTTSLINDNIGSNLIITWDKTKELFKDKHKGESSYRLRLTGYGAVLYPPNSLSKEVLNVELFTKIIPTHDDVWLWAMALLNGTRTRLVKGYSESINYVENSQKYGLCKINKKGVGIGLEEAYARMVKVYPEIMEILIKEQNKK